MMITKEFNDSILEKIENLSAKDIIQIFKQIRSEQQVNHVSIWAINNTFDKELKGYGVKN